MASAPALDEAQELRAGARVLAEAAEHARGHHAHPALVHAAGGHALVRADHDHAHALRLQHVLAGVGDLRSPLLLHLEAARVGVHHPGQLADAHDLARRQVAHVDPADDRGHVVLAVAFVLDVAQHDHLVVAGHLLEGAGQVLARVLAVAAEPVAIGLGHPPRGVQQALAAGVLARPAQQGAHGLLGLRPGDGGGGGTGSHGRRYGPGEVEIVPDRPPPRPAQLFPAAAVLSGDHTPSPSGRGARGPEAGSHMPPAGPIARLRELIPVTSGDPALLKAQYRAFAGQLPLMYALLVANTWLLAWTHMAHAPPWLTVGAPALLTLSCLVRFAQWWRGRGQVPDPAQARRALVWSTRLAWPLALAFTLWALALFPYGDAYARSHVAFYMATSATVIQLYMMHLRPAMLGVAIIFNGGFILFFATTGEPTFVAMALGVA